MIAVHASGPLRPMAVMPWIASSVGAVGAEDVDAAVGSRTWWKPLPRHAASLVRQTLVGTVCGLRDVSALVSPASAAGHAMLSPIRTE